MNVQIRLTLEWLIAQNNRKTKKVGWIIWCREMYGLTGFG